MHVLIRREFYTVRTNARQLFTIIEYKVVRKLIILSEHLLQKENASGINVVTFMLYYENFKYTTQTSNRKLKYDYVCVQYVQITVKQTAITQLNNTIQTNRHATTASTIQHIAAFAFAFDSNSNRSKGKGEGKNDL